MGSNLKIFNLLKKYYFPLVLILLLTFSRVIPHPPKFTPIIAVAIMSGYFFKKIYFSIPILLISMLLSDIFIGFHLNMIFVYSGLFFIVIIFNNKIHSLNYKNSLFYAFCGSLIFFIISNFGVWVLSDLYDKNLNGLLSCYILAIPFFTNTLLSTIFFTYLCFFIQSKRASIKILN